MKSALPIDPFLEAIAGAVRLHRRAVVVAPPGSGKTTRVPPALAGFGRMILLQPRRVAARALARRIASEEGWAVGNEIGWQVRFEQRFTPQTRIIVATEGVLTRRLQSDPLLNGFSTVILDEFHERSIHADLAFALAREAMRARDDLRLVVMSATIDPSAVAAFLDDAPVIEVPSRPFALEIDYAPGASIGEAVQSMATIASGHILVFLPGLREIRSAEQEVRPLARAHGFAVHPLHGMLDSEAQDAVLAPSVARKIILSTNLAETSLTVEGVDAVIDSGLHRVSRFDPDRGIDRLVTERIPADAAEQRAGRAARTAPGRALRLWDRRDILRAHREPEIARIDLAGPLLDIIAWGADPRTFPWYERPEEERLEHGLELLAQLGALAEGRVTAVGERMMRFPLHPRLARFLVESGPNEIAARVCAILSERLDLGRPNETLDVLSLADDAAALPNVRRLASELLAIARRSGAPATSDDLRHALFLAFPDRVARRRSTGSARLLLSSGGGALVGEETRTHFPEWLLALDVAVTGNRAGAEARLRIASGIEEAWLQPTGVEVVHLLAEDGESVFAVHRELYGAIVLRERRVPPDPAASAPMLIDALRARGLGEENERLLRRARFAGVEIDLAALLAQLVGASARLPAQLELSAALSWRQRQEIDRLAPPMLDLPDGRRVRLDYREDGTVTASARLQQLFGLAETPRIGRDRQPVVFILLAPNGRPVQTTSDLRSFWERTYPEVRKELRGRYPKHKWPEDPRSAER